MNIVWKESRGNRIDSYGRVVTITHDAKTRYHYMQEIAVTIWGNVIGGHHGYY